MKKQVEILAVEQKKSKKGKTYYLCECAILGADAEVEDVGFLMIFISSIVPTLGRFWAEFQLSVDFKRNVTADVVALHPGDSQFKPTVIQSRLRILRVHERQSKASGNLYRVCSSVVLPDPVSGGALKVGDLRVFDPEFPLDKGEFLVEFDLGVDFEKRVVPKLISLSSVHAKPVSRPVVPDSVPSAPSKAAVAA